MAHKEVSDKTAIGLKESILGIENFE